MGPRACQSNEELQLEGISGQHRRYRSVLEAARGHRLARLQIGGKSDDPRDEADHDVQQFTAIKQHCLDNWEDFV